MAAIFEIGHVENIETLFTIVILLQYFGVL